MDLLHSLLWHAQLSVRCHDMGLLGSVRSTRSRSALWSPLIGSAQMACEALQVAMDLLGSLGCGGPARLRRLPWVCWVQWEHCSAPEVAIGMLDSVGALLGLVGCHRHAWLIWCERVSGSSEREQEQEQERSEVKMGPAWLS